MDVDEQRALDGWLTDPDNRHLAEQYAKIWDIELQAPSFKNAKMTAWKNVEKQITPQAPVKVKRFNPLPWVAAAAFAACLTVGLWMFANADGATTETTTPRLVYKNDRNQPKTVVLSEGSKLLLDRNTEISIADKHFQKREVVLHRGQVIFQVQHNAERPFTVKVADAEVQVLGTTFNVRHFENEGMVEVSLEEGSVAFAKGDKNITLVPGEEILYSTKNNTLQKVKDSDFNAGAWYSQELRFENVSLGVALKEVNQYLPRPLVLDNAALGSCTLTGVFPTYDQRDFVKTVETIFGVTIKEEKNRFLLMGGNCN